MKAARICGNDLHFIALALLDLVLVTGKLLFMSQQESLFKLELLSATLELEIG